MGRLVCAERFTGTECAELHSVPRVRGTAALYTDDLTWYLEHDLGKASLKGGGVTMAKAASVAIVAAHTCATPLPAFAS
jgi:hypothetical protein